MKNDKFYKYELEISNARIKYFDETINKNPEMLTKKINIINELKKLYTVREKYFKNMLNNPEGNKAIKLMLVDNEIRQLEMNLEIKKVVYLSKLICKIVNFINTISY